jgi:glyoxylase-like metal-dependent hydrolase (beta-lactamase superfamily II)
LADPHTTPPAIVNPEQVLDYPFATPPAPGETREVAPGVHWLRMPLPFALDHINLWLLEDAEGFVIVDCGVGMDATRTLWERIFADRIGSRPVGRVFATHCHPDHAGNAAWLAERFGATLWMSQADYLTAHAWRDSAAGHTNETLLGFYRKHGLDDERIEALRERGNRYRALVPEFPQSYRRIVDGEEIAIGGRAWRVVMGYGHAPEHASLYCEALGAFISGDMLLPRISSHVGVTAVAPDDDPVGLFLGSLARFAELLPAGTLVLPSHGLPFRGAQERIAQLQEHHALRLAEIEEACGEPRSAAELLGVMFRRRLDTHQTFLALGEAIAHLNYLHARGRVSRKTGPDGVTRFLRAK